MKFPNIYVSNLALINYFIIEKNKQNIFNLFLHKYSNFFFVNFCKISEKKFNWKKLKYKLTTGKLKKDKKIFISSIKYINKFFFYNKLISIKPFFFKNNKNNVTPTNLFLIKPLIIWKNLSFFFLIKYFNFSNHACSNFNLFVIINQKSLLWKQKSFFFKKKITLFNITNI